MVEKPQNEAGSYEGKRKRTLGLYLGIIAALVGLVAFQARAVLFYPSTGRSRVSAAAAGDAVYLVGGVSPRGVYLPDVLRVDTTRLRMRRVARMPLALIGCEAVAVDGTLYVVGGYTGSVPVSSILRLGPGQRHLQNAATLPGPRAFGAAVALGSRIAYIGGWNGSRVLDEIVVFDAATGLVSVAGRLPGPRQYAAAALFRGRLVVLGGEDERGQPCPDVLELDPATLSVIRSARMPAPPLHPRLAVQGDHLVCYDGMAEDQREALSLFDPVSLRLAPVLGRSLPVRDQNLALVAGRDALYLAGGTDTENQRQPAFLRVTVQADGGNPPAGTSATVQPLALRTFLLLR